MRDSHEKLAPFAIEELIERSDGSPLKIQLMAQALKEGTSFEDLRQAMDPQSGLRLIQQRVHRRLLEAGVPEILLRTIESRLADEQEVDWDELQRESNLPDSMQAALEQSGLFLVETRGEQHLLRASHPEVLGWLRALNRDSGSSIVGES
jgi:hypothetical protein